MECRSLCRCLRACMYAQYSLPINSLISCTLVMDHILEIGCYCLHSYGSMGSYFSTEIQYVGECLVIDL